MIMLVIDCTFVCVFQVFVRIVLAEEESLRKLTEDQLLVISYIVYIIADLYYCKPPVHIPQYEQEYENIELFSAPTATYTNDIPTNECSAYGIVVQR